jgi:hypothetical protein
MIFAGIGLLTLLITTAILDRRSIEERQIRWGLYELRDRLRDLAYRQPRLLHSSTFWQLDRTFTVRCTQLEDLSLWSLLPFILLQDRGKAKIDELKKPLMSELEKPENSEMKALYDQSVLLMTHHFLIRHMFLVIAVAFTFIGWNFGSQCVKWLSGALMSNAIRPVKESPPMVLAA